MKTVLITGAAGSIGGKLCKHLKETGVWRLRLLDRHADPDLDIVGADLSDPDGAWTEMFEGVDAVVHLAGNPYPTIGWSEVVRDNIDVSLHVLGVVRRCRSPRLVFASSNWVMAGYRFTEHRITPDLPPRPVTPYRSGKLFIERAGVELARETGQTFIALRIGYCQHAPGNVPGPHMDMGSWGQRMWLSDRDLCQGFEKALLADVSGGVILNLMSDNPGMRWDLKDTRALLGYSPRDGHTAIDTPANQASEELARRAMELRESIVESVDPTRY